MKLIKLLTLKLAVYLAIGVLLIVFGFMTRAFLIIVLAIVVWSFGVIPTIKEDIEKIVSKKRKKYEYLLKLIEKRKEKRLVKEVLKIFAENGILIFKYSKFNYNIVGDSLVFEIFLESCWKYKLRVTRDNEVEIKETEDNYYS